MIGTNSCQFHKKNFFKKKIEITSLDENQFKVIFLIQYVRGEGTESLFLSEKNNSVMHSEPSELNAGGNPNMHFKILFLRI